RNAKYSRGVALHLSRPQRMRQDDNASLRGRFGTAGWRQNSIAGQTVFASGERVYVPTNKRPIGMVFQSYAIWPHMTVSENVAYPLTIQRRSKDEIKRKVGEVLK